MMPDSRVAGFSILDSGLKDFEEQGLVFQLINDGE
jgi:hypothetical protein